MELREGDYIMKELKLMNLNLKNFKGFKKYELDVQGKDLIIEGGNEQGKTTLFDAFTFLLFGKDSLNRSDFEIKPVDEDGNVKKHGLEHEVEGVFIWDNKELILKRVYIEKWTKKRGQSDNNKKLTGHETKYYIDEVPVKMKEYNEKVQSIITEDVFRILTNPQYFNLFLDKNKRREMIMQLVGEMSDDDITNGDRDLMDFVKKLKGRDVEEHLKIVNEKKKKVNKELESIPTRIDEIELAMPELEGSKEEIIKDIEKCNQEIEGLNEKIIEIKNGQGVSEKRKKLSELELKRSEIENEHKKNELNDLHKIKASIQEKKSNIALLMNDLNYK